MYLQSLAIALRSEYQSYYVLKLTFIGPLGNPCLIIILLEFVFKTFLVKYNPHYNTYTYLFNE